MITLESKKKAWRLPLLAVVAITVVFFSCNDETTPGSATSHDPNKPVNIYSFQPDSGRIRDQFLINGSNFGNDPSLIKVTFNGTSQALVLGCVDDQILCLVPRCTDGLVEVSVQVGDTQDKTLPRRFKYKSSRQVITVAGTGQSANDFDHGVLDRAIIDPVYIGIDQNQNIFVTTTNDRLVTINEEENTIRTLLTVDQGFTHRCTPVIHPLTNWVLLGHESVRDRFLMLDPKSNWAPTLSFIRNWNVGPMGTWDGEDKPPRTKYSVPSGNNIHHYCLLYCEYDGFYYARYGRANDNGHIVRIDPNTWNATIIGMTPPGCTYGMAFNTWRDPDDPDDLEKSRTWELWMCYAGDDGANSQLQHSICTIDVRDTLRWRDLPENATAATHPYGTDAWWLDIMSSWKRLTAQGRGHRDGLLQQAQFAGPRQMNFDDSGVLYVGDSYNHCIRKVDTRTGIVSNYVGIPGVSSPFSDGNEKDATFREVHGIVSIITPNDYLLYASDWGNKRIRKIAEE